jgi:MFS family permease
MITGGKVGSIIGRRRAFAIGLVIYGCGSLTTALAPNLTVLLIGWSFLEGVGAALILPAIVALVAGNVPAAGRARAYGLIAAAGAMAVAVGPILGGAVTTFASWRYVFAGEVVVVIAILSVVRRVHDTPAEAHERIDFVGSGLSIVGLSALVFGVLRSGEWGWVRATPDAPQLLGVSLVIWLVIGGLVVLYLFFRWEERLERLGREPLVRASMLANRQLTGGLVMFFFQFMVQAGAFFAIPLFLSVVLELSALGTGARLLPLSFALLLAAIGVPKVWPSASPRRVARIGLALMLAGALQFVAGLDPGASAGVVIIPLILLGLGIGALASQLGAITVSAVPDEMSGEVGGLQNTVTNLGASLGTALVGSVLIASLTASFIAGVQNNPQVPDAAKQRATVELSSGIPFISDTDLRANLEAADVPAATSDAIVSENADARLDALRDALAVVALMAAIGLFFTGRIPNEAIGSTRPAEASV